MRANKRIVRWLILVFLCVLPWNAMVAGCVFQATPTLAGWWRVEVESYELEQTPADSQLVSLLGLSGCASEPHGFIFDSSRFEGAGEEEDIYAVVRLDRSGTVLENADCFDDPNDPNDCSFEGVIGSSEMLSGLDLSVFLPGRNLAFNDTVPDETSGEIRTTLHTLAFSSWDKAEGLHFPPEDEPVLVRAKWERTSAWLSSQWTADRGELVYENTVHYTTLDDIPAGMYGYDPAEPILNPDLFPPPEPIVTVKTDAGETLRLRARWTFVLSRGLPPDESTE